jgi:hypothetical protein
MIPLRQRIEQATLARVGRPEQDHPGQPSHRLSILKTPEHGIDLIDRLGQRVRNGSITDERNILFNKVEPRLQIRQQINQPLTKLSDLPTDSSTALIHGAPERIGILRLDQGKDTLRLGQVESTSQKGSKGEFTRLR